MMINLKKFQAIILNKKESDMPYILQLNSFIFHKHTLLEKCPNTEFLQVRMRENADQKKTRIWTLFTQ